LDGSNSLTTEQFNELKAYVKETIKKLSLSEHETHVGLMEYSDTIRVVFRLNDVFDRNSMNTLVDNVSPSRGTRAVTDKVLANAANLMFTVNQGGRSGANKVLIILTDESLPGNYSSFSPLNAKKLLVFTFVDIPRYKTS
jgi:predicted RNA-binding protein with EMAP domain